MQNRNLLAACRHTWGLTQSEVGKLLDVNEDTIGALESCKRIPILMTALGLELVFGKSLAELFPDMQIDAAQGILDRAADFSIAIEKKGTAGTPIKRAFLSALTERLDRALTGI